MRVKFPALNTTINVDDSESCFLYNNSVFSQTQNMKVTPLVAPNGSAPFVLVGTSGGDTLMGKSNVTNEIFGLDGKDTIMGVGGTGFQNFLYGGTGADVIFGGKSPNTIYGGAGDDLIFSGVGNGDKIYGGLGDDVIIVGDGNTFVEAGPGNDAVILGNGTNTIAHNVSDNLSNKDFYDGGGGTTTLYLGVSQAQYSAITTATLKIGNVNLTLPQAFAKYGPTHSGFNLGTYDSKLGFHLDVTAQDIKKLILDPNPTATNDTPSPLQINPALNSTLTFNVLSNDHDNSFASSGGVTPLAPTPLKVSDVSGLTISGATLTVKQIDVINPLGGEVAKFDLVKTGAPAATPHAILTIFSDGTTTLNTNHSFDSLSNFTISFQYTNDDGFGGHGTATALMTINQPVVNHPPVAVADPNVATTNQNTGIANLTPALLANDSDPDAGAVLSIASVSGDSHISLDGSGHVVFTPGTDFMYLAQGSSTTVNFMYTAKDQFGSLSNPVSASITVTGVNDAPVAVADPLVATTNQNTGISDLAPALLANDSDPDTGAVLSIASVSGDSHISLDGSGHVVFTPGTDFMYLAQGSSTTVNFMYTAKDQFGALSNPVSASISVTGGNDAPVAVADPLVASTNQNTGIADLAPALLANDSDPDTGAVLSVASVSGDSHITLDGSGHVVFTPGTDYMYLAQGSSTTVNFMYTAKDQFGALSNSVAASLTVNGVNDAPVAVANPNVASTNQNTGIADLAPSLLANDSDPDVGAVLSIASVSGDSHISLDGGGHVVFTPGSDYVSLAQGQSTTVNFSYIAQDQFGALSNSVAASLTINGVNDAPIAVANPNVASTNQNTGIADLAPALFANDSDPDAGAVLSIASVSGDSHISLDGGGHVIFTPGSDYVSLAQGQSTTVNFSYIAKDQFGVLSNSVAASLTVNGVNDAPVAVANPNVASTNQNTGIADLAPSLLANDSDPDVGAVLSIASVSGDPHISLDGGGHVVFTPGADYKFLAQGSLTIVNFTYTAQDQFGALSSPVAASLVVTGLNDAPVAVANPNVTSTNQNTGIADLAPALLANDTDVDVGKVLSIASVSGDSHISLDGSGHVVFTPGADFMYLAEGSSTAVNFMYTAKDQFGALSNTVAASLTVNGVNDAPILNSLIADQADTTGAPITPVAAGTHFSDPDVGDTLSYSAQLVDSGGLLVNGGILPSWISINASTGALSSVNANPGAGDAGDYYFKVTATDSHNLSVVDMFKVSISQPAPELSLIQPAPIPQAATEYVQYQDTQGGALFDASSLFHDNNPSTPITYSANNLPTGLSIDPVTGFIYGQASVYGNFNSMITATDSSGHVNANVGLTVNPESDQLLVKDTSSGNYYALSDGFAITSQSSLGSSNMIGFLSTSFSVIGSGSVSNNGTDEVWSMRFNSSTNQNEVFALSPGFHINSSNDFSTDVNSSLIGEINSTISILGVGHSGDLIVRDASSSRVFSLDSGFNIQNVSDLLINSHSNLLGILDSSEHILGIGQGDDIIVEDNSSGKIYALQSGFNISSQNSLKSDPNSMILGTLSSDVSILGVGDSNDLKVENPGNHQVYSLQPGFDITNASDLLSGPSIGTLDSSVPIPIVSVGHFV